VGIRGRRFLCEGMGWGCRCGGGGLGAVNSV